MEEKQADSEKAQDFMPRQMKRHPNIQ